MCLLLHWAPCYIILHTHICDLWPWLHTEEKLANSSKLIGLWRWSSWNWEKNGLQKKKKKWLLCQSHLLFIYFDKQSFALIIHVPAGPGRSVPFVSVQPRLGAGFSTGLTSKHPTRPSFHPCEGRQLKGAMCTPATPSWRMGVEKGRKTALVWGTTCESGSVLILPLCLCPESSQGGGWFSHLREEKVTPGRVLVWPANKGLSWPLSQSLTPKPVLLLYSAGIF